MLNIRLIGSCGISDGEVELELPHSRKTRALLGYLVATDKSHRRDSLCDMFWERTDDPKGALRWSLSKLRPLLNQASSSRIDANRQYIAFHPVDCEVDIDVLRAIDLDNVDSLQTLQLIEFNALLSGEFLANLDLPDCDSYQFWLTSERARLRELRIGVLKILLARTDERREKLEFAQQLQAIFTTDELRLLIRKLQKDLLSQTAKLGWQQAKSKIAFVTSHVSASSEALCAELSTRLISNNKFTIIPNIDAPAEDSAEQLAHQHGVRYLVKLNVTEASGVDHITIQLVDTYDKAIRWGDLFDIHGTVDRNTTLELIASSIASQLVVAELARVKQLSEEEMGAWEFYLRSLDYLLQITPEDNEASRHCAIQSIERDPGIADCHAILATTYIYDALYDWHYEYEEAVEFALLSARAAVKVDPNDSSAVRAMGLVHLHKRDHSAARKYFDRACELAAYEPENIALLGYCQGLCGNFGDAKTHLEHAISMGSRDYFRATWCSHLALAAALAGEFACALDWAERCLSLNPRFPGAFRTMVVSYVELGEMERAQQALENFLRLLPDFTVAEIERRIPFENERGKNAYLWALAEAGLPRG